ncbi:MAG TPA: hypothetical protein VF188_01390 [Longimicrobiales bacterium]
MTLDELLYECGEMYKRLPPEKQPGYLAALNSIEGAWADARRQIDERITKWMRAAERDLEG